MKSNQSNEAATAVNQSNEAAAAVCLWEFVKPKQKKHMQTFSNKVVITVNTVAYYSNCIVHVYCIVNTDEVIVLPI